MILCGVSTGCNLLRNDVLDIAKPVLRRNRADRLVAEITAKEIADGPRAQPPLRGSKLGLSFS
jgi:hypothetical protein